MAVEPDGSLRIVGTANTPAPVVSQWRRVPPQVGTAAKAAATRGRAVWLPDLARAREKYGLLADPGDRWPSRVWLPVRSGTKVIGVVGVLWETPCTFDASTRRKVARITAAATVRARSADRGDDRTRGTVAAAQPGAVRRRR
jgi:hypothetical protein